MKVDVINLVIKAGKEILEVYDRDFSVDYKEDRSPLTEADRRAHGVITEGLKNITPDVPVLSEEGKNIPYSERKGWKRFWLVDPLDGTKEFIKRNGEFTVNVALIEEGVPVFGVVYAPALGLLYFAEKGKGAFRLEVEGETLKREDLTRAQRLPLKEESEGGTVKVVASRSHMNRDTEEFVRGLRDICGDVEVVSIGSSLKICLVAEGRADVYPRLGPTMEWDTASAHIVATESGCEVVAYDSSEALRYNKEDLVNPSFVVFRKSIAYLIERRTPV